MDGWKDEWMEESCLTMRACMTDGWMGHDEVLQLLLKHGASAKENKFGLTLRMVATQKENFKVAGMLLKPALPTTTPTEAFTPSSP